MLRHDWVEGLHEDVIVVPTKDRPRRLQRTLFMLGEEFPAVPIVIVDASGDDETQLVCGAWARGAASPLIYRRTHPGTAAQRNRALDLLASDPVLERIWWFDDDGDIRPGYRRAVLERFADDQDGRLAGVGGIALDPTARPSGITGRVWSVIKRAFLLDGPEGAILRSGRNVQVQHATAPLSVEWLQGGACCLRADVVREHRFDGRLRGYSWGEDFDFTFRLTDRWRLEVTPGAVIVNELDPAGRLAVGRLATVRTVLLHAWVREQRHRGLSLAAFWWSLLGEVLLVAGLTTLGRRENGPAELRGLLIGVVMILRGRSRRDIDPRHPR